jgi:hypothetical protein
MLKVAPISSYAHDIQAAPLRDQPVGRPGMTVLLLLVTLAIVLFKAVRAAVGAILLLLRPTLILIRSLFLVVGLVVVVGWGLVTGVGQGDGPRPAPSPTTPTQSAPEPAGTLLPADPTR